MLFEYICHDILLDLKVNKLAVNLIKIISLYQWWYMIFIISGSSLCNLIFGFNTLWLATFVIHAKAGIQECNVLRGFWIPD